MRVLSVLEDLRNYYDDDFNDGATFTCFMKLPLEIRVMIWKASLPGPRVTFASPESPFKTWFNFDVDTLYIGHCEAFHHGLPGVENLKHLAVFANSFPATALDKGYNAQEWWEYQDPSILEVFLDNYLAAAESLEVLTLVTRRYPHNAHAYTPDKYDDLSFIDLQDIDASLNFYKSPYEPKLEESFQFTQREYAGQLRGLASIEFDVLEEFCTLKCGEPEYEMPVIRNMIVTTTPMKAKLERAKAAFRVKKAEYLKSRKLLAT
ncbi:hypothetical protein BPAE_0078g00170 [Botrytis paeoniae]|uniref:2EXR domain-containing protein n=1 Tax=Botrytis paeoniae TaxID=278948 RepID=A0A4Z1FPK1_9HELO|nr:hypothetical protein BPAE_0078g00170 [Botrytis paeoniae]